MILQALYEYYQRKAALGGGDAAPEGFQWKDLPYLIVIDRQGNFVRIEDTQEKIGKKLKAKQFLVPIAPVRSGSSIRPGLLWDQMEYALGANPRKRTDIAQRFDSFRERIKIEFAKVNHPSLQALQSFLDTNPVERIGNVLPADEWNKLQEKNSFIAFRIDGEQPLTDVLFDQLPKPDHSKIVPGEALGAFCPVSGGNGVVPSTHSKIKGVWGAQSAGATLVAFNLPASESYGKTQNKNAQMSEFAADGYTKALNMLLGDGSKNRVQVGDASTVFWSEKDAGFENEFPFFWSVDKDNPDRGIQAVETLLKSPYTGAAIPAENAIRFYVLGLSPNAARISVRFWHTGTIGEFADRIRQHFQDLKIVEPKTDKGNYALYFLLSDIALENKVDNIPPNLAGNIMRAILSGGPYPATLLQQAVRRIRAKRDVRRTQAALLKAYLNRFQRFHKTKEQEINVSLDLNNTSPGYRLGRLFAVLEKIQEDAHKPAILNATIRDRFYGAASSSPVSVFPQLLKLKNHHLAKIEHPSHRKHHENILTEIIGGLGADMPAHLNMDDQARFAIGYYHQRQAFFVKAEKETSTEIKN